MLIALGRGFDVEAIDRLLFLDCCAEDFLVVSGDGLLHFARLIAAGLANTEQKANNNWQFVSYTVNLTKKGKMLIHAWKNGDRVELAKAIGEPAA
jgi:hypothetical protein